LIKIPTLGLYLKFGFYRILFIVLGLDRFIQDSGIFIVLGLDRFIQDSGLFIVLGLDRFLQDSVHSDGLR
jgi:hypothetical protein